MNKPAIDGRANQSLLDGTGDDYTSTVTRPGWMGRALPSSWFYWQFLYNVYRSSVKAKQGRYDAVEWSRSSHQVLRSLESVGVEIDVSGLEHVRDLSGPCVFVGNHMSMLETILLPAMIQPLMDVTFVVKQSLIDYPVFRHVLRSRNPIAVSRINPREDLKTVMTEGADRLQRGISVVVFPQTTRSSHFDPSQFNTIAIKLALRSSVPVIPIALKTDAWGNGRWIKDLGPIDRTKPVRFRFGPPVVPTGRGEQQHQQIIDFIQYHLSSWTDNA